MNTPQPTQPAPSVQADKPALIEVRGVSRVYKQGLVEVHALRGVDLDIGAGEFTALVGPSGSGKSTLLNVIGALDAPTAGTVRIGGELATGRSRAAGANFRLHNVGFVFQAYNLLPVFSAFENAEYTLMLQGVPRAERKAIVMPLLERVGLADMANRRPHELSGGQQQRIAVVRAIAPRPRLVLADEPTANLDSHTSGELIGLMQELNAEHGITFVFASHDEHLMERARRVVHLRDGLVERDEVR
ncbi:MAG: ABC transporter ATP-binding protein [Myxococcota bacterium]